jgi:hypothetical protein
VHNDAPKQKASHGAIGIVERSTPQPAIKSGV